MDRALGARQMRTNPGRLASLAGVALVISCSVGSLLDAPPTKVIGITPARVVDSAPARSAAPRAVALVLSSARGDAPPPWTAHSAASAPWLSLAPDAPDTLQTTLDPSNLDPGVYRDTIVIVPDDPSIAQLRVPVELRIVAVEPPPPPPPPPP